jgi:hypothetical protein
MLPYPMRCLLLISLMATLAGCSPLHKQMKPVALDVTHLQKFKPAFTVALYSATVDVTGNHLSGLLLIKKMPDSSTRLVFTSEMGLGFFDFEFGAAGEFKVHSIIKKMNRRPVIKTLQHDFELVLMNKLLATAASVRTGDSLLYFIFPQEKGYNYYITDAQAGQLLRMQRASNSKVIVEGIMKDYQNGIPDTIGLSHKTFEFNIGLKRIERNAAE